MAASANVALAVREGEFDIVHVHDPLRPGVATAALKHSPGADRRHVPRHGRAAPSPTRCGRAARERYLARIDALLATSPEAAELAPEFYPGDYTLIPAGMFDRFQPGIKPGAHIVAEWTPESRPVVKALVRMVAATPDVTLTLLWVRRARRPIRPYIPPAARGRVHTAGPRGRRRPRRGARRAPTCSWPPPTPHQPLTWEALASGCARRSSAHGSDRRARTRLRASTSLRSPLRPPLGCSRTPTCAQLAGRARDRSGPPPHRFDRVAETLERPLPSTARPPPPGPRCTAPPPTEILADLHMHTNHSHDCATPVARADRSLHRAGTRRDRDHRPQRGRPARSRRRRSWRPRASRSRSSSARRS